MTKSCAAYGCTARRVAGASRTFHRFPKNAYMCKKWIKATRRKDFKPASGSYICSDHFVKEAFDESKTSGFCSRRYLKPDAVPSIFAFPENFLALKKVKTHKPPLNQKCPQSVADVDITKATDNAEETGIPSSPLKSIKAPSPTIQYVGDGIAKPNSGSYIDSDHFVKEEFNQSNTGFCSAQYLRQDAVLTVLAFPDHLEPKKEETNSPPLNEKYPHSTADVEITKSNDYSTKSIKSPTIRYVGDCIAKDTDSFTDIKRKLDFVLSAYQLQQKRIKMLMQQGRRMNKRYTNVKNMLDVLLHKSDEKKFVIVQKEHID